MSTLTNSERIRQLAITRYIAPATKAGKKTFVIPVKELMKELEAEGFPRNRPAQFCTSIQRPSFLEEQHVEVTNVEGPKSGTSTTVKVHYRFADGGSAAETPQTHPAESPAARAHRITEKMRGLLKEEFAEYGGGEAFLRWIRSEDDEESK